MGTVQTCSMILERSGQPGRFSFFPKGALTHHPQAGGGIPPVGRARALFTKRPQDASPEGADNAASRHCLCSRQGVSKIETPCRLPAKTCHRQLYRRDGCVAFRGAPIFSFIKRETENERRGDAEWRIFI